jgi:phosphatidylserine decarboxylase
MAGNPDTPVRFLSLRVPVAREGFVFIFPILGIAVCFWVWGAFGWAFFFSLLAIFTINFFRDPERSVPPGEKAVLSPADGKILRIDSCREERFLRGPSVKISIFMSVFNVHVNRIPVSGRIADLAYRPGKFFSANLDKASAANEQNALLLETAEGARILFVQIAGLIARRIVCRVKKGDAVRRGARFGMIRFGSRVDVYLPPEARVGVRPGQKAVGGQTVLGYLP